MNKVGKGEIKKMEFRSVANPELNTMLVAALRRVITPMSESTFAAAEDIKAHTTQGFDKVIDYIKELQPACTSADDDEWENIWIAKDAEWRHT